MKRAAAAVRSVKAGHAGMAAAAPATNRRLYTDASPLDHMDFDAKVALLGDIDAYARAADPRVRQVSVSLTGSWQVVDIVRAGGEIRSDIRPLVRLDVAVVVGAGERQESGRHGVGGRVRYRAFVAPERWRAQVDEALRQAAVNLDSRPAPRRRNPGGAGSRLARHPAARGRRARPRGRFQPQEDLGLFRPHGR